MFKQEFHHKLDHSVSSLCNNLDVLVEKDANEDFHRMSYLTVSKTNVDILHTYHGKEPSTVKVIEGNAVNKCYALQAKWCQMHEDTVLVVTTYKGVLIFDGEGQLLLFWHNLRDDGLEESTTFCRGIACVQQKYICVGTSAGNVLVITAQKNNSFSISQTLQTHGQAISAMTALGTIKTKNAVDFVCGDDGGLLCTYKSGNKFTFVAHLTSKGETMPCTSLVFLPEGILAAGYMNGKIRLFDTMKSTLLAEICAHGRTVSCLDATFQPGNSPYFLMSGGEDSFIRVWKVSTHKHFSVKQAWYTPLKDMRVCGLRCDPSGHLFAVTAYDKSQILMFLRP